MLVPGSRQLSHFLAVVEHGSIGRAAKALNITEPALSKTIRGLEDLLQVPLFNRLPRGLELTMFGKSLASHARVVGAELRRAVVDLRELRGAEAGQVHVGAGPSFAIGLLPRVVAALLETRPHIRVSVIEGYAETLVPMVLHGEIDFAVVTIDAMSPDAEICQERLATDEVVIVARASHPLASRGAVDFADLIDQRWILPRRSDMLRARLEVMFGEAALPPPVTVVDYASAGFACRMLLEADVVSFLPRRLLQEEFDRGSLVELMPERGCWTREIGILSRRRTQPSPAARLLMDGLRADAGGIGQ